MKRGWSFCAWGLAVLSVAASANALDPKKEAEGKKAFTTGVNLVNDPDGARYEEALPQFRKAYDILQNWKVLGNIGICAMKLERDGEAIDAFAKYLEGGGAQIDAGERTQVQRDLETLKEEAATVHLKVPQGSDYLLDQRLSSNGTQRTNRYEIAAVTFDLRLRPGQHKITVHTPSGDLPKDVNFTPGSTTSLAIEATAAPLASAAPLVTASATTSTAPSPAPPPKSGGLSTGAYVAGGATIALAAGALITGIVASSKHSTFESDNGQPGHTQSQLDDERSSGKSMAVVSTVLTAGAILGAGVTAYFVFAKSDDDAKTSWLGVGPGSVSAGGTF